MSQLLGKAFIKVDGQLLETESGASLDLGGVTRNTIMGGNKVLGYAEQPKQSVLTCEIAVSRNTSLAEVRDWSDVTTTFEADTGQTWVQRNAWCVNPPVVTAGEGGKVPLTFEGAPAEEMGA